ncbi:malectin domain-containing carbohydrate-binding protein [Hymenobacter volaticus]|uniref:Malectin domain-containing carbohydrate-binding protein n=1 Tax=Hymenobacter volaticus TaxID=2932254 RepID=A0ABY4G1E5_9BACT|nr:malectin domain-containing carbohydrate-binding protein [Hymenobacter volaticus]UOQ64656.1 malectin domain-containing carbohydrate-binding protein [Hymenobacter volaticus]
MKENILAQLPRTVATLLWGACLFVGPSLVAKPLLESPTLPVQQTSARLAASGDTIRINCGGGAVQSSGKFFEADAYFNGGKSFSNSSIADVLQTNDDELYRTEHSASANLVPFSYNIPVSAGTYTVRLHFAEIYFGATGGGPGGAGRRVFNVNLEGRPVLVNYDIVAEAGSMTAVVKEYQSTVTDNTLTLDFAAVTDQPSVAAIEVLRTADTSSTGCQWVAAAPSALERKEGQSAVVNGQLYTFGGYYGNLQGTNLTQRYDVNTNQWTNLAPAPYPVTHMGVAVVDEQVWLIGGFQGEVHPGPVTAAVQVYDTRTNTWNFGPSLPAPRGSNAAALVGRKIHAFGGVLPDRHTDAGDHYVLDVDNLAAGWQSAAPLPNPRNHLAGASLGGKVYAIGGQYGHDQGRDINSLVHVYDPATNTWTRLPDLPGPRSHFEPGTFTLDGQILIVGGSNNSTDYADILSYTPDTNSWRQYCSLPATLVAPFAQAIGNKLVVAQGARDNFAVPEKTTQVSTITRTPSNVLRFSNPQLAASLVPGGSTTLKNLLWTLSGTASYTLTLPNAPAWLSLSASTGTAGPLGQEVALQVNAAGLAPGTYTATIAATAPGYAVAGAKITLTVMGQSGVVLALNAGGSAYTDATNITYQNDQYFSGGSTFSTTSPIANTSDDLLYQTERYGNFSYNVPLSNGTYRVTFKLAEIFWQAPQQRQFDILAENQVVVNDLDMVAQVGSLTALDIVRTVTVTDGELNLQFRTDLENAKLAALLIESTSAAARTSTPTALKTKASTRVAASQWSLYPNPVSEKATLSFTAAAKQAARVEVLNSQGQVALQETQSTVAGANQLELATSKLAAGVYIIRVYLQEGIINARMLVVK